MRIDDDFRIIYNENEEGYPTKEVLGEIIAASPESVQEVLAASEDDPDGRSQMFWFRLQNGDLMLACFPQGDTYFATELDHGKPRTVKP